MNLTVNTLLFVLLIQCGITAAVMWPANSAENSSTNHILAPSSMGSIDEIHIGDEFDNEAVLVKSGEQWLLPNLENLPADSTKVNSLIENVINNTVVWPIAHSPAARQRFQVADYYYQRRLTFFSQGKNLDTIYLGTSPGFRKVHARNDNQDAIFSITLNTFDTPAVSGAWLEPRLLQIRTPVRIDSDFYNLRFENGHWLSGIGGTPDESELESLITALKSIQIDGVANEDLQRELSSAEADLILHIQSLAGDVTLELITLDNEHFINSSEYPFFFKLSAFDFDRLTGIDPRLVSGEDNAPQ